VTPYPVLEIDAVSPDGQWVAAWAPAPGREEATARFVFPAAGGSPIPLCDVCYGRWSPDGQGFYLAFTSGGMSARGSGRTFVLPVKPGRALPEIAPGGWTEAALAKMPGVPVIESADVAPGPGVYAFSRETVQRNLYRIPLP
jgi:hypothetical protein